MNEVPAVLKRALAERRTDEDILSVHQEDAARVIAGDLRIVTPLAHQQTDSQLVLVLKVVEDGEFADVMLVHSATEFATDHDAIVLAEDSATPYDVVVQTDLRSVVWVFQLGARVGYVPGAYVDAIVNWAAERDDESVARCNQVGIHHGTRLTGLLDRRWAFKESEGNALRYLASDCIEALLDRGGIWRVHPDLLRPEHWDHADDAETVLGELVHWSATRELSVDDHDLESLLDTGALEVDSWARIGDLGADLLMSLQEVVLDAATGVRTHEEAGLLGWLVAEHLDPVDLSDPTERVHYLGVKELVPS